MNRTGNDGENTGEATTPRIHFDLRSYSDGQGLGSYNLVLRASDTHTGDLRIDAVTEDGAPISCPLAAAYDEKGQPIVVTGNPGCLMQIGAGLRRSGSSVRVVHPIDLLDAAYAADART